VANVSVHKIARRGVYLMTMKTSTGQITGVFVLSIVAALILISAIIPRSRAQPANPASNAKLTNGMAPYIEAVEEAIVSGTEATNLTEVERNHLMNEAIKTNLAAQLWFRSGMVGKTSAQGAKMAEEIRVLESLRTGHTDEAIRRLENDLDSDIILLAQNLRVSDQTKAFQPTSQPLEALKMAREYRLKFPYRSGDPDTDKRVKDGLSYLDQN
jgi:hypothetical protein